MAFKLAELQLVSQVHGRPPLLLLDDVSSELDPHRSELLFGLLGVSSSQCILTTTARDYIHLPPGAHADYWAVSEGRIASLAGV
jgi:DNA replication and repair protein RecF